MTRPSDTTGSASDDQDTNGARAERRSLGSRRISRRESSSTEEEISGSITPKRSDVSIWRHTLPSAMPVDPSNRSPSSREVPAMAYQSARPRPKYTWGLSSTNSSVVRTGRSSIR
ncbi:MAG: hypothetical protein R2704_17510 [Microthrixaceae bacterium]